MTEAEEDLAVLTDAEVVEWGRRKMQASISRCIACLLAGKAVEDFFAVEGLPRRVVTVKAADVREIGGFELELPPQMPRSAKRHWVYRCREDRGKVYIISWPNRMKLQQVGCVQLEGLTSRDSEN